MRNRYAECPSSLDALVAFLLSVHDEKTALYLVRLLLIGYERGVDDTRFENSTKGL